MTEQTNRNVKPLTITQAKLLFEVLRNETDLTGLDINNLMKSFKNKGLIRTEEVYL